MFIGPISAYGNLRKQNHSTAPAITARNLLPSDGNGLGSAFFFFLDTKINQFHRVRNLDRVSLTLCYECARVADVLDASALDRRGYLSCFY